MKKKTYIRPKIVCEEILVEGFLIPASADQTKENVPSEGTIEGDPEEAPYRRNSRSQYGTYGSGRTGWGSLW